MTRLAASLDCISAPGGPLTVNAVPASPGAPTVTVTQPTCTVTTGTITITSPLPAPGITYSIDGITYTNTSGIFSAVASGTYNVTVQNSSGCISIPDTATVNPAAAILTITTTRVNVACFGGSTGTATASPAGGTGPYSYSWNTLPGQNTATATGLAPGTYTVTVTDANGCTATADATISQPGAALAVTTTKVDVACFGTATGTATATPSGGTAPFTYSWNSLPVQTTATAIGLPAGTYNVTVTDAGGCTAAAVAIVTQPAAALTGTVVATNVLCYGGNNGAINLTPAGGTAPYTFLWSNSATTEDVSTLVAGSYSVKVTDAKGCFINVASQVNAPAALSIESTVVNASCPDMRDGSITLTITGGIAPYNIIWSDGLKSPTRTAGDSTYSVVVTDANLCATSLDIPVTFDQGSACLQIPKVITPNGDGKNDTWIMRNIDMYPNAELLIFNRWGILIYHTKNIAANPWDGRYGGKLVPVDSYQYILYLNDGSKPRSGDITVIR
jgi:gliding motility-associated-like protein